MARTTKTRENIEVLSFTEYTANDSSLIGFATVRVDRVVISGVRLMVSKFDDWFVNMPSNKGADNNFYNIVWVDTGNKAGNKALYDEICDVVKDYYDNMY